MSPQHTAPTRSDRELLAIARGAQSPQDLLQQLSPEELTKVEQLTEPRTALERLTQISRATPLPRLAERLDASEAERTKPVRDVMTQGLKGAFSGAMSSVFHSGDLLRRATGSKRILVQPDVKATMTPPPTTAGRVGFGGEQLAEFLVPLGVTKWMGRAPQGLKLAARMLGEGAEMGAKTAVQAGPELQADDVVAAALIGGLSQPVVKAVKAVGKSVGQAIPERLYHQVFPAAEKDLLAAWQSGTAGQTINPTLAREVLDRGLRGSAQNMGIYSLKKLAELETKVQALVTGGGAGAARPLVTLPKKAELISLLDSLEQQFSKSFFSERALEAGRLKQAFQAVGSDRVRAADALATRRLFDNLRAQSSFRLDPNLSSKQEELKGAADYLRGSLAQTSPEFAALMNEERIFIQARDAVLDRAVADKNRRLIGMMDMLLGGGGIGATAAVGPMAMTPWALARGFQQPFMLTNLAQGLYRLGLAAPSAETVGRAGSGLAIRQDVPERVRQRLEPTR